MGWDDVQCVTSSTRESLAIHICVPKIHKSHDLICRCLVVSSTQSLFHAYNRMIRYIVTAWKVLCIFEFESCLSPGDTLWWCKVVRKWATRVKGRIRLKMLSFPRFFYPRSLNFCWQINVCCILLDRRCKCVKCRCVIYVVGRMCPK